MQGLYALPLLNIKSSSIAFATEELMKVTSSTFHSLISEVKLTSFRLSSAFLSWEDACLLLIIMNKNAEGGALVRNVDLNANTLYFLFECKPRLATASNALMDLRNITI